MTGRTSRSDPSVPSWRVARPVGPTGRIFPCLRHIFAQFSSVLSVFHRPVGPTGRIFTAAADFLFTCFRSPGDRSNRPVHVHSEDTEPVGPTGPTHTERSTDRSARPVGPLVRGRELLAAFVDQWGFDKFNARDWLRFAVGKVPWDHWMARIALELVWMVRMRDFVIKWPLIYSRQNLRESHGHVFTIVLQFSFFFFLKLGHGAWRQGLG